MNGGSEYTINVGLIINQKPVAGVIYAPKKKRMFYAYGKKRLTKSTINQRKKIRLFKKIRSRKNSTNQFNLAI